ncbi:MAG: TatD family hydrolase [Candidatus Omnitrophica bacterium]|nr:TatD family hydrolase [Candidatus Omnitrophota bacterium]
MLIDTHCHLDFPEFDSDRDEIIQNSKSQGVDYIINVGSSLEGSERSVELANKYDCVYAVVGVHPHEADAFNNKIFDRIKQLAKLQKIVAIGEIGLDYFRNFSLVENQRRVFTSFLSLAKELNLPLVLHSRDAQPDTLEIVQDFLPLKAVVHCFSGGEDFLKSCLELGFYISYTCNITYKKAQVLRDLVKITPLERIFLETDAPYLSPEGMRGKRNYPANVRVVAEEIALVKETTFENIANITTKNAVQFFGLK